MITVRIERVRKKRHRPLTERDGDGGQDTYPLAPHSSPLISPIYQPAASVLDTLAPFQHPTNGRPRLSVSRLPSPSPRLPPSTPVPRPKQQPGRPRHSRTRPGTWPDNERTPTLFQPRLITSHPNQNSTRPLQNNSATQRNTAQHGLDTIRLDSIRIDDHPPPSSMPPTTGSAQGTL